MHSAPSQFRHRNTAAESRASLTELVTALEHATQSTKQLSQISSSDPCHLLNAYSSLRNAHLQIGSFLHRLRSVEEEEDEPMADEDSSSYRAMEKVEEGMKGCALRQTKRCKRPPSPSWAEDGTREPSSYDPTQRQRSLDLVFQFHG